MGCVPSSSTHNVVGSRWQTLVPHRTAFRSARIRSQVAPTPDSGQEWVGLVIRWPQGATVALAAKAIGWATPSICDFFGSLKKRGIKVSILERVREISSGKEGARGSYTVCQITE
jgi:hypothetical protein